jgi:SAM-dependent methyltransferase
MPLPLPWRSAEITLYKPFAAVAGGVRYKVVRLGQGTELGLEEGSNVSLGESVGRVTTSQGASTAPDYLERNRAAWDQWAPGHVAAGRKAWRDSELRWGVWGVPESRLGILRTLEPNHDVIELGCGTAEISAWLARHGARPVAIDISPKQVRSVETFQQEFSVKFPVIAGNAEHVMYEDASFDLAISEYGASLWCDPLRWLPEASRLLRDNGRLVFVTNSALVWMCTPEVAGPAQDRLVRDYFARPRIDFHDGGPVEFHLTHGDWIRALRSSGFVVDDLIEVRPAPGSKPRYDFVSLRWARRWPSEEIWVAHKVN